MPYCLTSKSEVRLYFRASYCESLLYLRTFSIQIRLWLDQYVFFTKQLNYPIVNPSLSHKVVHDVTEVKAFTLLFHQLVEDPL